MASLCKGGTCNSCRSALMVVFGRDCGGGCGCGGGDGDGVGGGGGGCGGGRVLVVA